MMNSIDENLIKNGAFGDGVVVLEEQPIIDVVPVVRCKDCKHWGMHKSLNVPWCFEMHIDKSEDGFCDIGERREE